MNPLRHAWTHVIEAADYEAHMAAIGQAQANAALLDDWLGTVSPPPGTRVLMAGAGTGQIFDYLPPETFLSYRTTFTDLNRAYLARLASRLKALRDLAFEIVADDLEESRLAGPYDLAIVILVLEHVDWRRAVASLCRVTIGRIYCGIQENTELTTAGTPVGTMSVFATVHPELLRRDELDREFLRYGFSPGRVSTREVADHKRMVGLEFIAPPSRSSAP